MSSIERRVPKTKQEAYLLDLIDDVVTLDDQIAKLRASVVGLGEAIPGLADKEMKRAGDAAIDSLAARVSTIATNIAGDAAKAERNKSALKLTYTNLGALVVSAFIFGGTGFFLEKGANAINMSHAKDLVAEANSATEKATADLAAYQAIVDKKAAAEIEKIRAASGWAGTPAGQRAKNFFVNFNGQSAVDCNGETWKIAIIDKVKYCLPERRGFFEFGADRVPRSGWKIP